MQSFIYFPSIIYRDERPDFLEAASLVASSHLERLEQTEREFQAQSGLLNDELSIAPLREYILTSTATALTEQGYNTSGVTFSCFLWAQETYFGGGFPSHVHPHSLMSGFYFIETQENGSFPVFEDPRPGRIMSGLPVVESINPTAATTHIHFNSVVPGTLLMTNSWLNHTLTTNYSEKTTRTLHFTVGAEGR